MGERPSEFRRDDVMYLSVCSGIEAASVAWHPLGWRPLAFSEIEPFPRAVLAHHYPDVPIHGDFTKLRDMDFIVDADVLVGGTPCQAFSVAGLRKSLDDDRGNLSLEYVRLADAIDNVRLAAGKQPAIVVWENVPGVLSVKDNAFGCFLAGLAGDIEPYVPPRGKWTNSGLVIGPARTVAWRILDAQYFGLAQRRRRVFVVSSAREGFDPKALFPVEQGMRRDFAPSRKTGKEAAAGAAGRAGERSHWDGVNNPHPTLNQSFNTGAIGYSNQELFSQRGAGLVGEASTGDLSHCLNAGGMGRLDYETETLVTHALLPCYLDPLNQSANTEIAKTLAARDDMDGMGVVTCATGEITHALTTRSAAEEDGTGRGTPIVPFAQPIPFDTTQLTSPFNYSKPQSGDPCHPLVAGAICKDSFTGGAGGRPEGAAAGHFIPAAMAVRRLTPVECERLQGFPDNYTLIPWRNKPAADCPDGPRYKALGNSMAVPCMRWIGARIRGHIKGTQ